MTGALVELSVILPTRNGEATIGRQLDALARQLTDVRWELVVVDNGSSDRTLQVVAGHPLGGSVRVVEASAVPGLSYARNCGVEAATGKYVAFCDDDDELDERWIDRITDALREHPFVASQLEYEKLNGRRELTGRARYQEAVVEQLFGYDVANGAGMGIDRDLWLSVGGNDISLRRTGEDLDFAIRVQRQTGVRPRLARGATYHYRQRSGVRATFRQARAYGRGHVMLYKKHGRGRVDVGESCRAAARSWWWLLSRAPIYLFRRPAEPWARRLGIRVGRLHGSAEQRCWYP